MFCLNQIKPTATFIYSKLFISDMQKRGQLGLIEFRYFMIGLGIGIVLALVLVFLGSAEIIPVNFCSLVG